MKILPLGAGQDVGKSCIILSIGGKNVMLDCGMHMGYDDDRRFPDFEFLSMNEPLACVIDCVLISHFHLDHCGALPHMTEIVGYNGPIYMTRPTKAICPVLLKDFRKIVTMNENLDPDRRNESSFFTDEDVDNCMRKVKTIRVNETIEVIEGLWIKAYYAGHVIGACMFLISVEGNESALYTGDYNMTPDRHLGAARVDECQPDVLITESTYATTIRGSRYSREQDFLAKVQNCIQRGGKVLIPCFALGRAQELCILLDSHWTRQNITVPVYFSTGLTEKAVNFYKMFITWTSENVLNRRMEGDTGGVFDFRHIRPFRAREHALIASEAGPAVIFATPGMLHAGTSLQLFRKLAPNPKNMIVLPGYCVKGTVGDKLIKGERRFVFENNEVINARLEVQYLSFSAHADAKGIIQLIETCRPKAVVLVHGERQKMDHFIEYLSTTHISLPNIPYYRPANGQTIEIQTERKIHCNISEKAINETMVEGILVLNKGDSLILPLDSFSTTETGAKIEFSSTVQFSNYLENLKHIFAAKGIDAVVETEMSMRIKDTSIEIKRSSPTQIRISWTLQDDQMAEKVELIAQNEDE